MSKGTDIPPSGGRLSSQIAQAQAVCVGSRRFLGLMGERRMGLLWKQDDSRASAHTFRWGRLVSLEESLSRDDPAGYTYKVRLLEEEATPQENDEQASAVPRRESGRMKEKSKSETNGNTDSEPQSKWAGSLMGVSFDLMSYVLSYSAIPSPNKQLQTRWTCVFKFALTPLLARMFGEGLVSCFSLDCKTQLLHKGLVYQQKCPSTSRQV